MQHTLPQSVVRTFVLAAAAISVLTILELVRAAFQSAIHDVKARHGHRRSSKIQDSEDDAEYDLGENLYEEDETLVLSSS